MEMKPITVKTYSGYKADEYPVAFYWKNQKHEIKEIVDRWYEQNRTVDWLAIDYFKVCCSSGLQCIISHDMENDQWYMVKIL